MGRRLALVSLLLLVSLVSGVSSASEIVLDGVAGFHNRYRPGEWTPVTVSGISSGPAISGKFVLYIPEAGRPPACYTRAAEISSKPNACTLYVLMPSGPLDELEVRFIAGGRTRARVEIGPLRPLDPAAPFILNLTDIRRPFAAIEGKALGVSHSPFGLVLAFYESRSKEPPHEAPSSSG